ncbi:hypothetical protein [Echinicola soli]|nr:hypothetical protein [Echinicola soli]
MPAVVGSAVPAITYILSLPVVSTYGTVRMLYSLSVTKLMLLAEHPS